MIIGDYSHLSPALQLSMLKLLIFIDGLECMRKFEKEVDRILASV